MPAAVGEIELGKAAKEEAKEEGEGNREVISAL
jgi:hypothetical protein